MDALERGAAGRSLLEVKQRLVTRQRYRQKALYTTLEVDWGSDQSGQQGGASLKESSGW